MRQRKLVPGMRREMVALDPEHDDGETVAGFDAVEFGITWNQSFAMRFQQGKEFLHAHLEARGALHGTGEVEADLGIRALVVQFQHLEMGVERHGNRWQYVMEEFQHLLRAKRQAESVRGPQRHRGPPALPYPPVRQTASSC